MPKQKSPGTLSIKTFEDACKALNLDAETVLPDVSAFPPQHHAALIAGAKLILIAEALNEGWRPDWNNYEEYKYYPWFDLEKTTSNPSGFSLDGVAYAYALSAVGSRLCFRTRELAEYAGRQFEDYYRQWMMF